MKQKRRIGVRPVSRTGDDPALVQRLIHLAAQAEQRGFELFAVPERFGAGGVPSALPVCAAVAAATQGIAVATAVLPLSLHHPLRVAEETATVDGISAGRFELGVGIGADPEDAAGFGLESGTGAERFEESLAIIRAAWRDEAVCFSGKHFSFPETFVYPKPARPGGIPVWVGARGQAGLRRAAGLGVGVLAPAGLDATPYLEACAAHGAQARLAVTGAPDALAAASLPADCELWVVIDPAQPDPLDAAMPLLEG